MTIEALPPRAGRRIERLDRIWAERPGVLGWLTTVDHKRIALLYFFTTLAFFLAGGVQALLIRAQLAGPDEHLLSPAAYDELMTMHGVTMIFLFVIPMSIGAFGNYLVPLMIGARDMAFPRLNALSYWLFLGSGLFLYTGLIVGSGPNVGWFDYVPLALDRFDPGRNVDFYALGLIFNGLASTATAVNFIVTIFKLRAPGMSLNRMPLFCFAILAVSFALVFALPALTLDLVFLELQRRVGFHFFDVGHGGTPLLWQHLFWLFGHPEVYIIVLPAFGIATSIIPTFAKRKMVAFPLVALAELLVAFIGFGVWAHHMFATGLPTAELVFFAAASMMVVIPSTIQVFAWTLTVNLGRPEFRAPLLFIGGFIVFFVIGGLSGIMFAAIPFDQAVTDTYFVVAHFHFIIFGAAVFPLLGDVLLVSEGHRADVSRAPGPSLVLALLPRHEPDLLPDAPRRPARNDPSRLHVPGGTRVGSLQPRRDSGRLPPRRRPAADRRQSALEQFSRSPRRRRSLLRRHARMGDDLTTSRVQLPGHPHGLERLPQLGPWGPRGGPAAARARPARAGAGPRDPRLHGSRRLPRRGPRAAGRIALAGRAGALRPRVLRDAPDRTRRRGRALRRAGRPDPCCVARQGAGGGMSQAALAPSARTARANGWWGIVVFVATEATLFGTILGSYFYLRFNAAHWPPPGVPEPKLTLPLTLTGILVATSVPMLLSSAAARTGRAAAVRGWLLLAMVVQGGYLAMQLHLFAHDLGLVPPGRSAYGSIYFTMLGAHDAHVAAGILLDAWLLLRLLGGLTRYRLVGLQATTFYWHFVNALALAVVAVQLSPRA